VGTFYGECDQLCGVNHDQMPIEIKVVSPADFAAWVASKAPAATPASAAPASGAPAAASAAAAAAPPPAPQKVAMNAAATLR